MIDELQAGPQLDALIAEKVMDWASMCFTMMGAPVGIPPDGDLPRDIPHYSTDIKAAWEVVERVEADSWHFRLAGPKCRSAEGKIVDGHDALFLDLRSERLSAHAIAETPTLAICRAALKAVGVTEVPVTT